MHSGNVAAFVLMRFNVAFPGFEHLDSLDPDWLHYRLRLADLTSFHSLKEQSFKDFKLVLLINPATPQSFIDALKAATQGLKVILLPADGILPQSLPSVLRDHADAGCVAIQTSRLDSDDMFHPDYLRTLNDFCARHDLLPEIARGARYFRYAYGQDYVARSGSYSRILYPENAFGTLIEPATTELQTVFCDKHKRMARRFVSYLLEDETPMWCRILHGANLLNKPRKPLPLTAHFPVHPDLADFARRPAVPAPAKDLR